MCVGGGGNNLLNVNLFARSSPVVQYFPETEKFQSSTSSGKTLSPFQERQVNNLFQYITSCIEISRGEGICRRARVRYII